MAGLVILTEYLYVCVCACVRTCVHMCAYVCVCAEEI